MNISAVRFAQLIALISIFTSALAGTGKSQCNCQDADGQYDTFTHYCCAWQIEHISVWIFNEDHECDSPFSLQPFAKIMTLARNFDE